MDENEKDDEMVGEEAKAKPAPAKEAKPVKLARPKPVKVRMSTSTRTKAVVLLLVNLVLLVAVLLLLDFFEIIAIEPLLHEYTGLTRKEVPADPEAAKRAELRELERQTIYLMEQYKNDKETLRLKTLEMEEKKRLLEKELEEMALAARRENLDQKLAAAREENLRKMVADLYNMPPDKAVAIMLNKTNEELFAILEAHERWCEENEKGSLRSYYLSLFPPDRAAEILRLQRYKPLKAREEL